MGELRFWNGWAWTPSVAIEGQVVERPLAYPPVARPSRREGMADLPLRAGLWGLAAFAIGVVAAIAVTIGGSALDLAGVVVLLLSQAALWAALVGACVMASRRFGTGHLARDFGLRFRPSDVSWGLLTSVVARVAGVIILIPFVLVWPRLFEGNQNPLP